MTTILQPPTRLAGANAPEVLDPSWAPGAELLVTMREMSVPVDEPAHLRRAREMVAANRHSALAHARLAQACQDAGREQEAIEAAGHALALGLDQSLVGAVHAAIAVLCAYGRQSELAHLLDDARAAYLPLGLRLAAAAAAGQHAAALTILADSSAYGESSEGLAMLAFIHLERDEYEKAIAAGRRAQAAGRVGFALYANLGYAHAALGQLAKAIKLTRQSLALAPNDRRVALNLAGYLLMADEREQGLDVLERQRLSSRIDVPLALAIAHVQAYAGEREQARRLLQNVRASQEWAVAETTPRAELEANLALLRWQTGQEEAEPTIAALLAALAACDYRSLSIAYLLTNLTMRSDRADVLSTVIERLQSHHPPAKLSGLRTVLSVLGHDVQCALHFAHEWVASEPLSASAAALTTDLVADLTGDFGRAAEIGLAALSRTPSHVPLINNTAYALALAGRPNQAKRVLDRLGDSPVYRVALIATRALVDLSLGRFEQGLEGYRLAMEAAIGEHDLAKADLVRLNAILAAHGAGLKLPAEYLDEEFLDRLALSARTHVDTWIVGQRLRRELGIDLDAREVNDCERSLPQVNREELKRPMRPSLHSSNRRWSSRRFGKH